MTTVERIHEWRQAGIISAQQAETLSGLARRDRVSVYLELSALLYLGVLFLVGGLGWTFREYVADLGDAVILSALSLVAAAAFYYCFTRAMPYAHDKVEPPSLAFAYVLYLGCLVLSSEAAYLEYRFEIFRSWHHHLLLGAVVFAALAYRFDNRFVLSLALSGLAGWLGLRIASIDVAPTDALRGAALLYGAFTAGLGSWLARQGVKPHFLDVYLHLAANVVLAALASGIAEPSTGLAYLTALIVLAGAAAAFGIMQRRFAFVAYGTLYAYGAVSVKVLEQIGGMTAYLFYQVVTGTMVLVALVVVARRFGRDE
jgi:hypothetical protein